jgi:CBS domain-containing protein
MLSSVQTQPLISVRSTATVKDAARLMADCSIGALGVLDEHKEFAGIITERDLTWFVAQGLESSETAVSEVVNDFPIVLDGPVDEVTAIDRMHSGHIRHLIVHDDDGFRVVSMRDVLHHPEVEQPAVLTATDVMTAPAIACRGHAFFEEVAEILADRDISGMPVVDCDGMVVGVISERDLAHALGGPIVRLAVRRHNHERLYVDSVSDLPRSSRRAKEIMSCPPLTVQLDERIDELARIMRVQQVNRLPVLDGEQLVGVVTRGDVLGAIGHLEHRKIDLTRSPVLVGSEGMDVGSSLYRAGVNLQDNHSRNHIRT